MAKCKIVGLPEYELRLTKNEAETLLKVVRNVGGNPRVSRRKHTQAIMEALEVAGVKQINPPIDGCISFFDELPHESTGE